MASVAMIPPRPRRCGSGRAARVDVARALAAVAGRASTPPDVPLTCLPGLRAATVTTPCAITPAGRLGVTLSEISVVPAKDLPCP